MPPRRECCTGVAELEKQMEGNTEEIELLELLGSFADEHPVSDAQPIIEGEEEYEPEPIKVIASQKPVSIPTEELPALLKVLRGLPSEQRAEALELATTLGVGPGADDILYSILVGLGYHKTVLGAVPDRIAGAGEQAIKEFSVAAGNVKSELAVVLAESAGNVIQAGEQASVQIQKIVNSAAAQIQIAAGKGAQNAVEKIDISPIIETAISKIASKTEIALAKKWFSRAIIIASISTVLIAVGAGYSGYKIAGFFNSGNANTSAGDFYLNQLQCSAANNGVIPCRDQFGNAVKFRSK